MSATAVPRTGRVPRLPQLAAHPTRWGVLGLVLWTIGIALGVLVTTLGPVRTGELRLDTLLSVDREWPLVALSDGIDVGLGPMVGPVLLLVACAVVARRQRWSALALGVTTIVGWGSVKLGKVVFARPRPPALPVHPLVRELAADSFPSGHTAFAAALLGGVILALRLAGRRTGWAWAVGVPAVVVVAVSRLYLGAHYLGDVVGSWLFVGGTVLVLVALVSLVHRRAVARR